MESIRFREAVFKDLDDMVALLGILFSIEKDFVFEAQVHEKGLKMLLEDKEKRSVIMVAEKEKQVIGMVTAQLTVSTALGGASAWLEDLVVHPEYQNRGIGHGLLEELTLWCSKNDCKRMQLLADKDNLTALDFYKKADWLSTNMIPLKIHL